VCGLNLEIIQIQTKSIAFNPKLIPKALNPLLGRPSLKPAADPLNPPAQQLNQPTSSTREPHPCLSRCRAGPTRQPPLTLPCFTFSSSLCPAAGQPSRCARAGDAMDAPSKRPARRGPECARRVPDPTEGVGNDLNAPHRAHPRPEQAAATGSTCPSRRTARGIGGNPPRAACGLVSKGRQAGVARTPSHQPLWGFPLATAPACAGLEEGGSAPPPRRAGQGRSREPDQSRDIYSTGTPSTRQGRRPQPPLVGRRGGRPRRGRGPDRSRDIYIAGNAYFATPPPVLEPATTTPPPRREHHRSHFPLSSLLELFSI
jgi:hypothetical protein